MQTSYVATADVAPGYHGMVHTSRQVITVIPSVTCSHGQVVCADRTANTPDEAAKLATADTDLAAGEVMGVLIRPHADEPGTIDPNVPWPCLKKGLIWLNVEDAVSKWSYGFVRFVAAGSEVLGALRSDADTADAVAVPGIRFRESTTAAGLCLVEFDL